MAKRKCVFRKDLTETYSYIIHSTTLGENLHICPQLHKKIQTDTLKIRSVHHIRPDTSTHFRTVLLNFIQHATRQ